MKKKNVILSMIVIAFMLMLHTADADEISINDSDDKSNEVFRIESKDGKAGVIDEEGNEIIPCTYDDIVKICGEYICAFKEDTAYVIDRNNNIIASEKGLIVYYYDGEHSILSKKSGKLGTNDYDGTTYDLYVFATGDGKLSPTSDFSYDYIEFNPKKASPYLWADKDNKHGMIDWNGNIIVPVIYDNIDRYQGNEYSDTLCVLETNGKYGLLESATGKITAPCIYTGHDVYLENLIPMQLNGKWGYIDSNGNIKIEFKYDRCYSFKEGFAVVENNSKRGLIDKSGKEVIPCKYENVNEMSGGQLSYGNSDGSYEFTNPLMKRDINIYRHIVVEKMNTEFNYWVYSEAAPFIQNGRTLVPIRTVAELCGFEVGWNQKTKEITLSNYMKIIKLKVGSSTATVNIPDDKIPENEVQLDVPAQIVNGRTYVPLRFIGENAGIGVNWDNDTRNVIIYE